MKKCTKKTMTEETPKLSFECVLNFKLPQITDAAFPIVSHTFCCDEVPATQSYLHIKHVAAILKSANELLKAVAF